MSPQIFQRISLVSLNYKLKVRIWTSNSEKLVFVVLEK